MSLRPRALPVTVTIVLIAAGCGESAPAPTTRPGPAADRGAASDDDPAPSPGGDRAVDLPPHGEATPTQLVVVNRGAEPITLVLSAEPFSLEARPGEPESMRIGGFGPLVDGPSCECRCGFECLVCEPPQYEERVIAPGETFEATYSGRVRVYGGGCFEPYALPPGPRRFTVCLEGAHMPNATCASADVDYPTPRVEVVFGAAAPAGPGDAPAPADRNAP